MHLHVHSILKSSEFLPILFWNNYRLTGNCFLKCAERFPWPVPSSGNIWHNDSANQESDRVQISPHVAGWVGPRDAMVTVLQKCTPCRDPYNHNQGTHVSTVHRHPFLLPLCDHTHRHLWQRYSVFFLCDFTASISFLCTWNCAQWDFLVSVHLQDPSQLLPALTACPPSSLTVFLVSERPPLPYPFTHCHKFGLLPVWGY